MQWEYKFLIFVKKGFKNLADIAANSLIFKKTGPFQIEGSCVVKGLFKIVKGVFSDLFFFNA